MRFLFKFLINLHCFVVRTGCIFKQCALEFTALENSCFKPVVFLNKVGGGERVTLKIKFSVAQI